MNTTSRVDSLIVTQVNKPIVAKLGKYTGHKLQTIVFKELETNKSYNLSLKLDKVMRYEQWRDYVKVGNVLKVHISSFNGGKEYVDFEKKFELVDVKAVNQPEKIRQQEPKKDFKQPTASELANGVQSENIRRALEGIRQARTEIKRAEQDIEKALKAIEANQT